MNLGDITVFVLFFFLGIASGSVITWIGKRTRDLRELKKKEERSRE